jgi:hypothetical protein
MLAGFVVVPLTTGRLSRFAGKNGTIVGEPEYTRFQPYMTGHLWHYSRRG